MGGLCAAPLLLLHGEKQPSLMAESAKLREAQHAHWNAYFQQAMQADLALGARGHMRGDPWLQRWLPLVRDRAAESPILELGCGSGEDTATLVGAGHSLIAVDLSQPSIAKAKARAPQAEFYCQDICAPFPKQAAQLGVVVASLSLHYFPWPETLALVERIRRTLRLGGVLLCRLNSTNDHNYGASGHARIAENYYSVHGEPKRFFDEPSIQVLFGTGWSTLAAEELVTHKYAHPKSVWEVVVGRDA